MDQLEKVGAIIQPTLATIASSTLAPAANGGPSVWRLRQIPLAARSNLPEIANWRTRGDEIGVSTGLLARQPRADETQKKSAFLPFTRNCRKNRCCTQGTVSQGQITYSPSGIKWFWQSRLLSGPRRDGDHYEEGSVGCPRSGSTGNGRARVGRRFGSTCETPTMATGRPTSRRPATGQWPNGLVSSPCAGTEPRCRSRSA